MTNKIIETVLFKLEKNISEDEFDKAIQKSNLFVSSCKGFIARRLSADDQGQWIEHIEWDTLENAKDAASRIGSDENTQDLVKAIDGTSVQLFHTKVRVALDSDEMSK